VRFEPMRVTIGRRSSAADIGRRRFTSVALAGLGMAVVPLPFAVPRAATPFGPFKDLRFRVLRDGSEIGAHSLTFEGPAERMTVRSTIRLQVRVAFVTAFRYEHDGEEIWENGRIVSLRTRTHDNGPKYEVTGAPEGNGFRVVGPGGPFTTRPDLLTSGAVWHPDYVRQTTIINVEQGGELGLSARKLAEEPVTGPGGQVMAQKYRMVTPQCGGFVWYDSAMRWLRADVEIKGEKLKYDPV
jgi:hypothetical protein